MGYYMYLEESTAKILVRNFEKALQAIKDLAGKETITDSSGRHFSWVDTKEFVEAETLEDALRAWRWEVETIQGGMLINEFTGQKYGDEEHLFGAIAPFVEDEGYIHMVGEDSAHWKWIFSDGKLEERSGRVVFD